MAYKRVLVTGGAGFIGSHLCERLLAEGAEVLCVDNFYSSTRRNIHHLLSNPRFELLRHDITFPLYVEVDEIYHLACPASPVFYQRDPVQTTKTSVIGSINMLGLAKRVGAPILLSSTSEVYGDPTVHPQSEDYWGHVNPIGPRGVYDEAKRYAEALTMAYHRQQGVDTAIIRIFNTYGARMRPQDGRAIPTFLRQALTSSPITVFGDGSQTRSFTYVDDLIDGMIRLAESGEHQPVNVGNPDEFTLKELAEVVKELTGSESEIVYAPLPTDDPQIRRPDISRARELLGWEPTVALRDGLKTTIDLAGEHDLIGRAQ